MDDYVRLMHEVTRPPFFTRRQLGLLISFVHSSVVVVVGALLFVAGMPFSFCAESWAAFLSAPTSTAASLLFLASAAYYVFDFFELLRLALINRESGSDSGGSGSGLGRKELGLLLHHVICFVGLLVPPLGGCDAMLVLLPFALGEVSNPPRLLALMIGELLVGGGSGGSGSDSSSGDDDASGKRDAHVSPARRRELVRLGMLLSTAHFALFVAARFTAAQWIVHVLLRRADSGVTRACAVAMLAFSLLALFEYVRAGSASTSPPAIGTGASAAGAAPVLTLAALRSEQQRGDLLV